MDFISPYKGRVSAYEAFSKDRRNESSGINWRKSQDSEDRKERGYNRFHLGISKTIDGFPEIVNDNASKRFPENDNASRRFPKSIYSNISYAKRRATTSYGIILYTQTRDGQILYFLGQRRDSISYTEFLRDTLPSNLVEMHINMMSEEERDRCLYYFKNSDFFTLWDDLWINHNHKSFKTDYERCEASFYCKMKEYLHLFESPETHRESTERSPENNRVENPWAFFKGRKQLYESNIDCAMREFEEETTVSKKSLMVDDSLVFSELYTGTDSKTYQTYYYVAYIPYQPKIEMKQTPEGIRKMRVSDEIGSVLWVSYSQACKMLDDGSVGCNQRVKILKKVNKALSHKREKPIHHKTI
jgi:8-oxo-dGTP pyrophosphatase MutT (NUDIX family)